MKKAVVRKLEPLSESDSEPESSESVELDYEEDSSGISGDEDSSEGVSGLVDSDDEDEVVSGDYDEEEEDDEEEEEEDEEVYIYLVTNPEPCLAFYDEDQAKRHAKKIKGNVVKVAISE